MTGYVDLSVAPGGDLEVLAVTARRLGIRVLGVPVDLVSEPSCLEGVLLIPRFLARASTRREAALLLRGAPNKALVVVEARSPDVARYAAVNKRVDVVRLPHQLLGLVDRSTARLFRERGWGVVEASLSPIMEGKAGALSKLFSAIRRSEAYGVPLALVSDARDPLELWHPYATAGLASLSGLPWERALSLVSTAPLRAVARRGWLRLLSGCGDPR